MKTFITSQLVTQWPVGMDNVEIAAFGYSDRASQVTDFDVKSVDELIAAINSSVYQVNRTPRISKSVFCKFLKAWVPGAASKSYAKAQALISEFHVFALLPKPAMINCITNK